MIVVQRLLSNAWTPIKTCTGHRLNYSGSSTSTQLHQYSLQNLKEKYFIMVGKRSLSKQQQKKIDVVVPTESDSDSGLDDSITESKRFRPTAHSTPKSTPKSLKDKLERYATPTSSKLLMPPPSLPIPDAQSQTPSTPSSPMLSGSPMLTREISQSQDTSLDMDFDSDGAEDEVDSPKKPLNMQKILSDAHEKDAAGESGKMDDRIGMKRTHTEEVMERGKCIHICL